MTLDYFHLDSILAEQEKISCSMELAFVQPLSALLSMQQSTSSSQQQQPSSGGMKVELPFWLAYALADSDLVSLEEYPRCFQPRVLEQLRADSTAVRLRDYCPYYFQLAGILFNRIEAEEQVRVVVLKTLKDRLSMVFNRVLASSNARTMNPNAFNEFVQMLDETEKQLFERGCRDSQQFQDWKARLKDCGRIKAIQPALKNPLKRSFMDA